MKKKNFQICTLIIILLLVAIALVFIFFRAEILLSPAIEYKITDLVNNVKTSPSHYTIVVPDTATSSIISTASDFASAFGEFQQTKKHSEINTASATKLIYLKIDSSIPEDSKAIYYTTKESLLVIAKDELALNNIIAKLAGIANYQTEFSSAGVSFTGNVATPLKCPDNTLYESCSLTKPKYCSVADFNGVVSLADKSDICGMPVTIPAPTQPILTITRTTDKQTVTEGEQFKVTLTVTGDFSKVKDQIIISLADEIIGGEISAPKPRATANIDASKKGILWFASGGVIDLNEETSASYNITASSGVSEVKFTSTGSAIYKIAANNLGETINITGISSLPVTARTQPPTGGGGGSAPSCTENWQCNSWGDCANNQRTRTCTDSNNCGTIITKPQTTEPCCVENWTCADWSVCANNQRTRTCTDSNNCGTIITKPIISETCTSCIDTDNGIDIFTTGIVSVAGTSSTDVCNSARKKITEYSCTPEGTMQSTEYDCVLCASDNTKCSQQFAGCTPACSAEQECVIPTGTDVGTCQTKTPETNLYVQLSSIETNQNHGYKGVIGKHAATTDSIGMVDIAGKFKITQTKADDQYNLTNIQEDIVIVGGPCINTLARELKNRNKFNYGCADWPGGGNFSVAEFIPDAFGTGKNVIFVAGTRAEDTREMTQVLKKYKDADKESKFKAKKRICMSNAGFCQTLGLTDNNSTL